MIGLIAVVFEVILRLLDFFLDKTRLTRNRAEGRDREIKRKERAMWASIRASDIDGARVMLAELSEDMRKKGNRIRRGK